MDPSGSPRHSSFEGYSVGQQLTLNVCSGHASGLSSSIQVSIHELHTRTLSCTMVVDILDGGDLFPSRAFLKLFDRRFADQLRRDDGAKEWAAELELAYIQLVLDGSQEEFLHKLYSISQLSG